MAPWESTWHVSVRTAVQFPGTDINAGRGGGFGRQQQGIPIANWLARLDELVSFRFK